MIEIISTGMLSSFQDEGRFAQKKYGVSQSGCLDLFSYKLANKLVKNKIDEACIEVINGPFTCIFHKEALISVTGPSEIFSINNNFVYQTNSSISVSKGDELFLPYTSKGNIYYLSISGGYEIKDILNSKSYHQPSNITEKLKISAGDKINFSNNNNSSLMILKNDFFEKNIFNSEKIKIIFEDNISNNFINDFEKMDYLVSDQLSRQGLRLKGNPLSYFNDQNEISSEVSVGTVQLPPDGIPIILLNDSQTTGGYKKIGSIPKLDLSKLTQTPVNSPISFVRISLEDSIKQFRKMNSDFEKINLENYTNKILQINGRLISVQISQNNSIMSIADNQHFAVNEETFE